MSPSAPSCLNLRKTIPWPVMARAGATLAKTLAMVASAEEVASEAPMAIGVAVVAVVAAVAVAATMETGTTTAE